MARVGGVSSSRVEVTKEKERPIRYPQEENEVFKRKGEGGAQCVSCRIKESLGGGGWMENFWEEGRKRETVPKRKKKNAFGLVPGSLCVGAQSGLVEPRRAPAPAPGSGFSSSGETGGRREEQRWRGEWPVHAHGHPPFRTAES